MTTPVAVKVDISSIFEQIKALKKESGEDLICFAKLNGFKLTMRQAIDILAYAVSTDQPITEAWLLQEIKDGRANSPC